MSTSQQQQPIRIGIIGTGIFAYRHLRAYRAVGQDKFQIVACANRSRDKAEKFAQEVRVMSTIGCSWRLKHIYSRQVFLSLLSIRIHWS